MVPINKSERGSHKRPVCDGMFTLYSLSYATIANTKYRTLKKLVLKSHTSHDCPSAYVFCLSLILNDQNKAHLSIVDVNYDVHVRYSNSESNFVENFPLASI